MTSREIEIIIRHEIENLPQWCKSGDYHEWIPTFSDPRLDLFSTPAKGLPIIWTDNYHCKHCGTHRTPYLMKDTY